LVAVENPGYLLTLQAHTDVTRLLSAEPAFAAGSLRFQGVPSQGVRTGLCHPLPAGERLTCLRKTKCNAHYILQDSLQD